MPGSVAQVVAQFLQEFLAGHSGQKCAIDNEWLIGRKPLDIGVRAQGSRTKRTVK
jgi:hypothetical protein